MLLRVKFHSDTTVDAFINGILQRGDIVFLLGCRWHRIVHLGLFECGLQEFKFFKNITLEACFVFHLF